MNVNEPEAEDPTPNPVKPPNFWGPGASCDVYKFSRRATWVVPLTLSALAAGAGGAANPLNEAAFAVVPASARLGRPRILEWVRSQEKLTRPSHTVS